jgi:hypothetical protein
VRREAAPAAAQYAILKHKRLHSYVSPSRTIDSIEFRTATCSE